MRTKRKTLIEERYYGIKKRQMVFMRTVQERAAKMNLALAPFFPNDLMFQIFLRLPVKSLLRFTCVCKSWKKLIHCAEFVQAYNNGAQTTAILLRKAEQERPNAFHTETQVDLLEQFSLFPRSKGSQKFIHLFEVEGGKGKITDTNVSMSGSVVAHCNGLLLIISMHHNKKVRSNPDLKPPVFHSMQKPGRLIILNPVTRKFVTFPLGTVPRGFLSFDEYSYNIIESYGLVFSQSDAVYKVVHLFKDRMGYMSCEVLSVQTRSWKAIDGPTGSLFRNFVSKPIPANGALHWLPDAVNVDYIVSMDADNEQFSVIDLPQTLGEHEKIVEMGGFLSFVSCVNMNCIVVWALKGLNRTEWIKQHSINIEAILGFVEEDHYVVPVFALNPKIMVFRGPQGFYSYDFELEEMREIEINGGKISDYDTLMPHSNNLATWEPLEPMS